MYNVDQNENSDKSDVTSLMRGIQHRMSTGLWSLSHNGLEVHWQDSALETGMKNGGEGYSPLTKGIARKLKFQEHSESA
uniref:Uncharacterized protein n=1 Tax=Salix viminalis TaxID=40686 RepID=A0A6N2MA87_SALVM